ncbi:MAG: hypothetical protein A2784_04115 [Candidatus Chisholmbacteria bacterium RIFCSPHIGHO2_01_FULL_48_12]|uniref:AbiEi antitoxin C-terminal domain-containing protein n=1 Tax=Candidatus Chisholmbacteria bacterium RIFCSPHIGHO2_01_FULL_48_12 TaxID=1797589 RepID=A0A1G1VNN7_9BACT|nr:MAG: hypothetical protein A2784_04115 [Candidatus Chisholmbacteria bacterium RIFCSPHIGHO2_01_FULL_48_12]
MKYLYLARTFREKGLSLFTTRDFEQMAGLSRSSAWGALGRYTKQGLVKSPKRGWYYLADNPPHEYLLANKLYGPSYVSFETALAYYSIIPETVYSIISATTKTTREFEGDGRRFKYMKIKQAAFTGYLKKDDYLIADPEKALVDYVYFVALGKKQINDRLNTSRINKSKLQEYAGLFENKQLNQLVKQLC